ncbi:MAG: CvpA family protein [Clostridia bacterium]|nr:CvpA family protein [Clostridia bacterium]
MNNLLNSTFNGTTLIADGILILIVALFVLYGVKKGFLGMIVGFLAGIVTIVVCSLLCGPVAKFLGNTLGLHPVFFNLFARLFDGEIFTTPLNELAGEQISNYIAELHLPEFLTNLVENQLLEKLQSSVTDVTIQSVLSNTLTNLTLNAIAWFALYIIMTIIFAIIKKFVRMFDKIVIVGKINKLLGGLLGFVVAFVFICAVTYIFILIGSFLPTNITAFVKGCTILGWFYNSNPLASIISMIFI